MPTIDSLPTRMTDDELLVEVPRLAACERRATVDLVAGLAELDERRLYLAEGYSSLFSYCTRCLHLSEDAAWSRVEAARAARRFPAILERLRDGRLTLTAVKLLARHLAAENCEALLAWAAGRTKREIEERVAAIAPRPDLVSSLRKLPQPPAERAHTAALAPSEVTLALVGDAPALAAPGDTCAADRGQRGDGGAAVKPGVAHGETPIVAQSELCSALGRPAPRPAEIRALAPERYSLRITISADTHSKLQRARALLRHKLPGGDPAAIVDQALTLLVEHLERTKFAARTRGGREITTTGARVQRRRPPEPAQDSGGKNAGPNDPAALPAPGSANDRSKAVKGSPKNRNGRHIPAAVKRAVWERDGGRCAFVGKAGRCPETGFLEFHHRVPFAEGGQSTASNVMLMCRSHNGHEATRWFSGELGSPGPGS